MSIADQNVIPGFRKMSKQRIFNKAVAHIAKTRKKSVRGTNQNCVYSGSGCNAAPLLANDNVRMSMDNMGGSNWESLVQYGSVPANNAEFINELQRAHDSSAVHPDYFMKHWKASMYSLATRWNLSTSTLNKVAV